MIVPDADFKWLGLISIVTVWVGLIYLLFKWRGDKSMSFSQHAAQTRGGQLYYFFLFITVLPLFYLFIIKWFVPALHLSDGFVYAVTAGVLGQLLAVLVPAIPGRKEQIHNFGAYLMAFTMLPAVLFIAFAHVSVFISVLSGLAAIYMLGTTILFLAVKRSHLYFLYFQASYIAIFHVIILFSTYSA